MCALTNVSFCCHIVLHYQNMAIIRDLYSGASLVKITIHEIKGISQVYTDLMNYAMRDDIFKRLKLYLTVHPPSVMSVFK